MLNDYDAQFLNCKEIKIIKGGASYFELITHLIVHAEKTIHLQAYILKNDETGRMILKVLMEAAQRKVVVYLLLDKFGSLGLTKQMILEIKSKGINFKFFNQFSNAKGFYLSRRMHHKIMVVDDYYAIIGGINIADRYNDTKKGKAWLDYAVLIEGKEVEYLGQLCNDFWQQLSFKATFKKEVTIKNSTEEELLFRVRRNDWVWHKNEVSNSYLEILHEAKKEIIIIGSYFLPGRAIRRMLRSASKRGVIIKVITGNSSDVPISKSAEKWLYDWILRHKITLYEYQKNVLHAKMCIADRNVITIGSYNINNLSTYASIELNIDIKNSKVANEAAIMMDQLITHDCKKITKETHIREKNILIQFSRWLSYQSIQLLFRAFTFYVKRNY